jgi:hypothetical protein
VGEARSVWLFFPGERAAETAPFRKAIARLCSERGWGYQPRQTHQVRAGHGPVRRLISGRDAHALYAGAHRETVGVLSIEPSVVALDPRFPQNVTSQLSCAHFVQHKAFNIGQFHIKRTHDGGTLSAREATQFDAFASWDGISDCEGLDDGRLLPLHAFDPGRDWSNLSEPAGRDLFTRTFGKPRTDRQSLSWNRAQALHGREELTVALYRLPRGFHWDVHLTGHGVRSLVTHQEVWQLSAQGYANVYPDAFIRTGDRSRRVWPHR